jgi:hypothetical protein
LTANYSLEVEVMDQEFKNSFLNITFHDIVVDFNMSLKNMTLMTYWNSIRMDHASCASTVIPGLNSSTSDKVITDFFNGAFYLIVPWVNTYHPYNITKFDIPREIPDLVKFDDLHIDIRDDYVSLALDPEFIIKPPGDYKDNKLYITSANWGPWDIMDNLRNRYLTQG